MQPFDISKNFRGIDGFLVTDINNIRYLSGFTGSSAFLLTTKKENFFITDFRYKEQSRAEVKGWNIIVGKDRGVDTISRLSRTLGLKRLGFETSVLYGFFEELSKKGIVLRPFKNMIEKLRTLKGDEEIRLIKKAIMRAESAFLEVRPHIKKGVREKKIALMLEERLKKKGCNRIPFDIIVASGKNSTMPHARPSEKKLMAGDLVIIDWGGEAAGYFSDMTRTLLIKGDNLDRKKEIYQTVLKANRKAVSAVSPYMDAREIDNSARGVIKKAGYGEFFGHGTGHGIGLQVHELPHITWNKKEILKENMVFTIEPGIYVPELGGVRIEDMIVVGKKKGIVLTKLSRELEVI